MKNILITSIGRRVELIQLFKKSIINKNIDCKVIGIDYSKTAPGIKFVDKFEKISKIESKKYKRQILSIIKKNNVGLIIPTIDTELHILSSLKHELLSKFDCYVLIPDQDVINNFRNKLNSHKYFIQNGFNTPSLLKPSKINKFPVFIKPFDGSSSIGASKVENRNELVYLVKHTKNPMIQEFIEGTEYSVDVFKYSNDKIISLVIRKRIAVRSGEISKGKVVKNSLIEKEIRRFAQTIKFIGNITIQVIKRENKIYFIEVNCRFGGGTPISIMAGANSCDYAIDLMLGKPLSLLPKIQTNITFARYDQTIFL